MTRSYRKREAEARYEPNEAFKLELPTGGLPVSKAAATRVGSQYFFNGNLCRFEHKSPRYTRGGSCALCVRIANARKYGNSVTSLTNRGMMTPERIKAVEEGRNTFEGTICPRGHTERYTASNNCVRCQVIIIARDAEKRKWSRVTKLYGLNKETYEAMLHRQNGLCPICDIDISEDTRPHIDHCHSSGRVRGLLCSKCNQAIGLFNENPQVMQRAMRYVCS